MLRFSYLNKNEKAKWLPVLFDLLYANMRTITPSGLDYAQEKALWLANVSPALEKEPRQIILCFADDDLAGFLQYYTRDQMLMIEEVQLKPIFQRTMVFFHLCRFLAGQLTDEIYYVEAYAEKRNLNSRKIMQKLGMEVCEESDDVPFVHLRGKTETIRRFLR